MPSQAQLQESVARLTRDLLGLGTAQEPIHNAVVVVEHPGLGLRAAAAAVRMRDDGDTPMGVDTQFHIASIVKPMTAALIFQAAEDGLLGPAGIDARLIDTGVLPPWVVRRLHNIGGRSFGTDITLRQMLTHTSGLRDGQIDDGDYVAGGYTGRASPNSISGRRYPDLAPHYDAYRAGRPIPAGLRTTMHWKPWDPARPEEPDAGLVNFYLSAHTAGARALFRPGHGFHYSDTAFTILALLAERLHGASFARLLLHRIYEPCGMTESYYDADSDLDPTPWRRELSDCWNGPYPLVSMGMSLSNDWGGGGVIATAADLNRFMVGLMDGRLFRRGETLAEMARFTVPEGLKNYAAIGHGLLGFRSPGGRWLFGHSGAWGAKMLHDPANGYFYSGTVNRRGAKGEWMLEIADAVAAL
jgi:D-alanyl-D-alanine carboxypeptidase